MLHKTFGATAESFKGMQKTGPPGRGLSAVVLGAEGTGIPELPQKDSINQATKWNPRQHTGRWGLHLGASHSLCLLCVLRVAG